MCRYRKKAKKWNVLFWPEIVMGVKILFKKFEFNNPHIIGLELDFTNVYSSGNIKVLQ